MNFSLRLCPTLLLHAISFTIFRPLLQFAPPYSLYRIPSPFTLPFTLFPSPCLFTLSVHPVVLTLLPPPCSPHPVLLTLFVHPVSFTLLIHPVVLTLFTRLNLPTSSPGLCTRPSVRPKNLGTALWDRTLTASTTYLQNQLLFTGIKRILQRNSSNFSEILIRIHHTTTASLFTGI